MIADSGSALPRSSTDCATLVERAIGSHLGSAVHSDGTDMRNEQTWTDIGAWIEIDVSDHRKELSHDA